MGGGVSTNNKSSKIIELSWLHQHLLNFWWFDLTLPINPPNHPPNYAPTHGWGIFHKIQIFKQNWIILISSSVTEFWLILVSPNEGWQVGGLAWGYVEGCTMHTHAHACMYAHTHMHVKHDKHGCLHFGSHLQFLYMYTCVCVHAHVCAFM